MADKKTSLGPTGQTAAANVKRIRERQRLSYAELSRKLDEIGRPIATLGLSRIENGARRIDADDLVALAAALGVSPITLLMPDSESEDETVESTAGTVPAKRLWKWLQADRPLDGEVTAESLLTFSGEALPTWRMRDLGEGIKGLLDLQAGGERAEAVMRKHPDIVDRVTAEAKHADGDDK